VEKRRRRKNRGEWKKWCVKKLIKPTKKREEGEGKFSEKRKCKMANHINIKINLES
jgi:hypothetical protein